MLLFSFLLFILIIVSYCAHKRNGKLIPVIAIGVVSAILVCSFKTLFLFSHRVIPYSFIENYIYFLFRQSVIPVFVLYALFFVISKDTVEYKVEMFFPLEMSFYAVFLPHMIVSGSEGIYSGYVLFVKPVVFACMLTQAAIFTKWMFSSIKNKKIFLAILLGLAALVYVCLPALFESMYIIKYNFMIMTVSICAYCLLPALLMVLTTLKKFEL